MDTPKLFELSVADRRYNKPERDRAKRSGLRIFMLGRMFSPKTLRHDRTHGQEVLMTSVRAMNISRKDFVLQEVRQKIGADPFRTVGNRWTAADGDRGGVDVPARFENARVAVGSGGLQ
ncbi:hypothetical protein [Sutterella megalosphaeroides]|uniref:hypothetical protein n=1 Tax=Sutterella megalosphaeroides TaxID=2494234 RepID=UPI000E71D614|nr:hypothetical protein [Sutterella megalosphaeroides]